MKFVIARSYFQYNNWCREQQLAPNQARFIDDPQKLMGLELSAGDVVDLGTDNAEIYRVLATRIRE